MIELTPPSLRLKNSFLAGLNSIAVPSERTAWVYLGETADFSLPVRDFESYVETLNKRQTQAPPGFVCDTTYWATVGDEVVGRISIRHELNEFLKQVGGHIGYITHPNWRGKGVASEMLAKILETPIARSIGRLLLTCDEQNLASERTILKNGGKLVGVHNFGPDRAPKKHFWIELHSGRISKS